MYKITLILTALLLLASCTAKENDENMIETQSLSVDSLKAPVIIANIDKKPCYFDILFENAIDEIGITENTADFEKIKAVYVYIIEKTHYIPFNNEEISATWRSFDTCETAPTYYEELATGVLQYGIGSCENYASAMVFMLEKLGMEAKYVPGATYSVDGEMVKHAWAMVKFNGEWYHVDPQLEDNISNSVIKFNYFMKNDIIFSRTHIWGENLPNPTEHDEELPQCNGNELIELQHIAKTEHVFFTEQEAEDKAFEYAQNAQEINDIEISKKTPIFPQEFPD